MTSLSPLDVRFACTCSHASGAHPPFPVMKCAECECDGYRPARCICHLTRDDGTKLPCYAEEHDGYTDSQATRSMERTRPGQGESSFHLKAVEMAGNRSADSRAAGPVLAESGGSSPTDGDLYAAWYERQIAERPEGHAAHRKRSVQWLMHPSHCPECGTKKIRWMAAQSEASHVGRNGRRLMEIYKL